jgi:hypothetical protein
MCGITVAYPALFKKTAQRKVFQLEVFPVFFFFRPGEERKREENFRRKGREEKRKRRKSR